jgi:RimJ/RimL family protein N-acetyltransferase
VDITFRPLARRDLPMLHEWLTRPHVAEWWGPSQTLAEITEEFGAYIADPTSVQPHIALLDGAPLGFIQSYVAMGSGGGWWEVERDPGVRGIDQFLANAQQLGQGLGTRMVRSFVRRLFEDRAVTRVQTDPSPANGRAIRCYEKAGFQRVGEVETPDGRALLMHVGRASFSSSTPDQEP